MDPVIQVLCKANSGVKNEEDYCCTWIEFDLGNECKYRRRLIK